MAQSKLLIRQYTSELFVESCGAILFDLSNLQDKKICLIRYLKYDRWLLAKGRRNIGESRKNAALREVKEETGFQCRLFPVMMPTRAPHMDEPADFPDEPRVYSDLTEPFMCTARELARGKGVKFIWWYIAALDNGSDGMKLPGENRFEAEFFTYEGAIEKLHFESDRDVLRKAIQIVDKTLSQSA